MRMMIRKFVLLFFVFSISVNSPVFSQSKKQLQIEVQAKLYNLSDERYKTVYGSGSVIPHLSFAYVCGLFEIRAETEYFKKTGKMTLSADEVILVIFPVTLGTRFRFFKSRYTPFIGAGVGIYMYKETVPPRLDSVSGSTLGVHTEVGFSFLVIRKIDINLNVRLISAKVKNTEVNLGGFCFGFGLAYNVLW